MPRVRRATCRSIPLVRLPGRAEGDRLTITPCYSPWDLTGEGWIFPIYTPFSETPIPLPEGSYAALESGTSADQGKRFHGGVGMVMVVRYKLGQGEGSPS